MAANLRHNAAREVLRKYPVGHRFTFDALRAEFPDPPKSLSQMLSKLVHSGRKEVIVVDTFISPRTGRQVALYEVRGLADPVVVKMPKYKRMAAENQEIDSLNDGVAELAKFFGMIASHAVRPTFVHHMKG